MSGFKPRTTSNGTNDQEVCSLRNCLAHSSTPLHDFPFAVSTSAVKHSTREDVFVTVEQNSWRGFVKRQACRQIQRLVVLLCLSREVQKKFAKFLALVG